MCFKSISLAVIAVTSLGSIAASAAPLVQGCHPTWAHGGHYSSGSLVSASRSVWINDSSGSETTAYIRKNFKCLTGLCPVIDPSDAIHATSAWSDEGECFGSAAAPSPSPISLWNGVGCPPSWSEGALYSRGELAEVDGLVYKCTESQFENLFCGMSSFKPGDSSILMVWTLKGACVEGSESTPAYKFEESEYVGGCPEEFISGVKYEEGDIVSIGHVVYVCRDWPRSEMCKQIGYEPDGSYSEQAWNRLGYCEGKFNSVFGMKARLCLFYFHYNRLHTSCYADTFQARLLQPPPRPLKSCLITTAAPKLSQTASSTKPTTKYLFQWMARRLLSISVTRMCINLDTVSSLSLEMSMSLDGF
jgi:hypothetical protein